MGHRKGGDEGPGLRRMARGNDDEKPASGFPHRGERHGDSDPGWTFLCSVKRNTGLLALVGDQFSLV